MENKKKIRIIRMVLLLIIIVCLIPIGQAYYLSVRQKEQQENLKESLKVEHTEQVQEEITVRTETDNETETTEEIKQPVMLERFVNLYAENNDVTGWLAIEDMNIDYPVMQCDDNEYYLHHNFYGEEDKYGCLYVKDIADVDTPGTNFIIYGHNMKDGSMFGSLDDYKEESFYREHSVISFYTLYEERTYEIMAVFLSQVYDTDAEVFKYYNFYEAGTQEEFNDFYENVKKLSLYDTGVTAEYGDTFLTLSTCAYHVEDGRFVVVAKRVK